MATEVQPMPMPMLVDLVNGWGTVPRAKAGDRDRPPIAAFAERHGAAGAGLHRRGARAGRRPALPRLRRRRRGRARPPRHRPADELRRPARAGRRRRPDPGRVARPAPARRAPGGRRRRAARPARRARARAPGYLRLHQLRRRLRGCLAGRAPALLLGHLPEPRAGRRLPPPPAGGNRVATSSRRRRPTAAPCTSGCPRPRATAPAAPRRPGRASAAGTGCSGCSPRPPG